MVELVKLKTTSQFIYKVASAFLIAIFIYLSIKLFQTQASSINVNYRYIFEIMA